MKEVKRLAIFAGYDKDNIIDDYVVYYIKELKKIADIIYVCDCNMPKSELDKIREYCIHIMNGRHGEYDFGSYKRGFWYARVTKLIFNYDYLLFCNDSVYGPFYDLKEIVESMEKKDLDAWSMFHCFSDYANLEHLQSYFISIFQRKPENSKRRHLLFRKRKSIRRHGPVRRRKNYPFVTAVRARRPHLRPDPDGRAGYQ